MYAVTTAAPSPGSTRMSSYVERIIKLPADQVVEALLAEIEDVDLSLTGGDLEIGTNAVLRIDRWNLVERPASVASWRQFEAQGRLLADGRRTVAEVTLEVEHWDDGRTMVGLRFHRGRRGLLRTAEAGPTERYYRAARALLSDIAAIAEARKDARWRASAASAVAA